MKAALLGGLCQFWGAKKQPARAAVTLERESGSRPRHAAWVGGAFGAPGCCRHVRHIRQKPGLSRPSSPSCRRWRRRASAVRSSEADVGGSDCERQPQTDFLFGTHPHDASTQALSCLVFDVAEEPFDPVAPVPRRVPLPAAEQVSLGREGCRSLRTVWSNWHTRCSAVPSSAQSAPSSSSSSDIVRSGLIRLSPVGIAGSRCVERTNRV